MTYNLVAKKVNQFVPFRFFKAMLLSIKRSKRDQCLQTVCCKSSVLHTLSHTLWIKCHSGKLYSHLFNELKHEPQREKNKPTIVSK